MNLLSHLYNPSLALLTDMYEITMAYGYWKAGKENQGAVFNLFFRHNPFAGGFTVAAGLAYVAHFLENFRFAEDDIAYLREQKGRDNRPLFEEAFLDYLQELSFTCDVDAVPEGTVVFPHEPLVRVKGSLLQAQLVESALLNMINFQSLIATKTARIQLASGGEPLMEFGLRRAQGIDGSLAASRASFIGGCTATSNVMAGKVFAIPIAGTHAHSWVMSFDSEKESFETFARALPDDSIFLVDTYNTESGIRKAIEVANEMRKAGHNLVGIRLDSGDLAYYSKMARRMLNAAGMENAHIVGSNDLDEYLVSSLKHQGASIDMWGIGTRLVTAYDQPALGGVYKLSAIEKLPGKWEDRIKLSEQTIKTNIPGMQQVKRFLQAGKFVSDVIYDERDRMPSLVKIIDPIDPVHTKTINRDLCECEDLLVPVFREGKRVYALPDLKTMQQRTKEQLDQLDDSIKRFENPHVYPVGLEEQLYDKRHRLILYYREMYR
ncbi:nicotinate phosphoribosyltransferase [Marinilabiliaceae bacterium JC017]|nr:nicotinate phosphoribosyltransferase [Marinilabiliaceae bacterium JC017]